MRRVLRGVRWILVTVGVILLTSFTIDATTNYSVSQSALSILVREATQSGCPAEMAEVSVGTRRLCIDRFESSTGASCPHARPSSVAATRENLDAHSCTPESKKGGMPWTYVGLNQARELCARAGKRLPNHEEWHVAALGVADPSRDPLCNVTTNAAAPAGSHAECESGSGAYDMIGNVWEWVEAEITSGTYNGRALPEEGYVASTDKDGVAITTHAAADPNFHEDYFWSQSEGVFMTIRGGFFGSGSDAGIYSVNAAVPGTLASQGIGFRCVKDLL